MAITDLPSQPAFTIAAQTASLAQGILNVPASIDSYIGAHGRIVVVTLPDEQRIHCVIDRKNSTKNGARLTNPLLKDYFGNKTQKGNQYRVKIIGTNAISIKIVEPESAPVELTDEKTEQGLDNNVQETNT